MKEILLKIMLVIQKLYKRNFNMSSSSGNIYGIDKDIVDVVETNDSDKETNPSENNLNSKVDVSSLDSRHNDDDSMLKTDHLKEKILERLKSDYMDLTLSAITKIISDIQHTLVNAVETGHETDTSAYYRRLTQVLLPFLYQLSLLAQLIVLQQVQTFHVSCQLLNRLLPLFQHFALKGFGIPPDLMPDEEGEESGTAKGGMGLGDGEGETDVSERIDSEDQLEDARPKGQETEVDDEKECEEEAKGIETSEDFGGKTQDIDKKDDDGDESEENNEEDLDVEMGDTAGAEDKLDKQVWGSDSEDEEEMSEDDAKQGEKEGEPELGAATGKRKHDEESDEEPGSSDEKRKQHRPEVNEMDEPDPDDDQVNPYHGKHQPEPEPEAFDLPDDLQLDDGAGKEEEEGNENNPFDIDEMKEQKESEEQTADEVSQEEEMKKNDKAEESDSSSENEADSKEGLNESPDLEEKPNGDDEDDAEDGNKITGDKDEQEGENGDRNDQEEAVPSEDQPSKMVAEPAPDQPDGGSKDQVSSTPKEDDVDAKEETVVGDPGKQEQSGTGGAQMQDDDSGHQGHPEESSMPEAQADRAGQRDVRKRERPGQSDTHRSLADLKEPTVKRLKAMDMAAHQEQENKAEEETEDGAELGRSAEVYQHIRDAKETFDTHTIDAATEEQAVKQPVPNLEEERGDEINDEDIEMIEDQSPTSDKDPQECIPSEKISEPNDQSGSVGENVDKLGEREANVEVEGECVETLSASRGPETVFNTVIKPTETVPVSRQLIEEETRAIRQALEKQLGSWVEPPSDAEAERAWDSFSHTTQELARDLCEQLRLVLEPTQASRLRGDFRTGRRINMRKVIPYIASQFRKDKIWLRRTKPSKREYQIVLGIDDSSSMDYNQAKEMTFESVALVSQALTLLEVGELGVVSFGENIRLLHQLGKPFTHTSGAALLQHLRFDQRSTRVGSLVQFVTEMFEKHTSRSSIGRAQLLVILSDGRGVRSEGKLLVERAIGRARQERIFTVFIIVDNPKYETSVLDVRNTEFCDGKVKFTSYMDDFPFPFYVVLRDLSALPAVLSDALRQWFELVATIDG